MPLNIEVMSFLELSKLFRSDLLFMPNTLVISGLS
jgi:hypothetical protein